MIESVKNERVKYWAKLNDKKYQNEEGLFLVEGEHLVEEAKKAGYLREVIVLDGEEFSYPEVTTVSREVMKKISALENPPKIIGVVDKLQPRAIEGNVVLLDGVQDPGNLGTIIRSAVAFGIDTVVLGENTVSVYNPKVVRATEGLLFHINILEKRIEDVAEEIKARDYTIYTTDVEGGRCLSEVEFGDKTALIMGSEGSGVREEIASLADERLYIPMKETCESLNVGVATSIILYELSK